MNNDLISRFAARYPFDLDRFQLEALEALVIRENVLVAAPTGSGKTVVGEFGVWLALEQGGKAFYTTPLKALSNQKFGDLVALHGPDRVGLLTGDNSINAQAPVVVMTTEVLRNMIYERSELLKELRYVILDEVHYLQDQYRGAVWEEVIIHLPLDVKIVSLSATVSNADEFSEWIQTLRGPTKAIMEDKRPVRLEPHYLLEGALHPMFTGEEDHPVPNAQIARLESAAAGARRVKNRGRGRPRPEQRRFPHRTDVVEILAEQRMLPAIYFIFSRKGCNAAVSACMREGLVLTDGAERTRIREHARLRCEYLPPEDLDILGYDEWLEALSAGVSAHHAGMIPAFKETVEDLFQAGLVKVCFATETLSLGINMPARTVVIESLNKFTGERHEILSPAQFTQLTGRAGRRGIDTVGHAVIPQQRDIPFTQIASLASTRTYPLISSFQPSYNMATNLVRNYSRDEADHLLNSSFAQYRADKEVVIIEQLIERNDAYLASYREKMQCDLGDYAGYWRLREGAKRREGAHSRAGAAANRDKVRRLLFAVRPGEVLFVGSRKLRGHVVVVDTDTTRRGEPVVLAMTEARRFTRLGPADFSGPPVVAGNLEPILRGARKTPGSGRMLDHQSRKKLAAALGGFGGKGNGAGPGVAQDGDDAVEEIERARMALLQHPCHHCPDRDRHAQWAERAARLERENTGLKKRVRARTQTLSRRFDKILEVLEEYRYVEDFTLTDKGWALARIYNENDLLVAETLCRGWLSDLEPAELAAIASTFVFESRGPYEMAGDLPTHHSKRAYGKIVRLGEQLSRREADLEMTRGTEPGFADYAYRWCLGQPLEDLIDEDSPPGDFIRSCKQTIDLLRQMKSVSGQQSLVEAVDRAIGEMNRGVVAYTGLI